MAATLGSGNLKLAVQLPEGEEMNEWIAVNSECILVKCGSVCEEVCVLVVCVCVYDDKRVCMLVLHGRPQVVSGHLYTLYTVH